MQFVDVLRRGKKKLPIDGQASVVRMLSTFSFQRVRPCRTEHSLCRAVATSGRNRDRSVKVRCANGVDPACRIESPKRRFDTAYKKLQNRKCLHTTNSMQAMQECDFVARRGALFLKFNAFFLCREVWSSSPCRPTLIGRPWAAIPEQRGRRSGR